MPRIHRLTAIYLCATVACIGVLLFGERGVTAAGTERAASAPTKAATYAGKDACVTCHEDVAKTHLASLHGKLMAAKEAAGRGWDCEGCHGPGSAHIDNPAEVKPPRVYNPKKPDTAAAICMACHSSKISPAAWRTSEHGVAGVRCWDCHSSPAGPHEGMSHRPTNADCLRCHREVEGQFALNTHHPVKEGRVDCADCHNPHRRTTTAEYAPTCRKCHKNARGPFVFAHGALESRLTDVCMECHMPHGSPNERLLKFPGRAVCLQCHADKGIGHHAGNCFDCHEAVHGSNSSQFLLEQ